MTQPKRYLIFSMLAALMLFTAACTNDILYSGRADMPLSGWDQDSIIAFPIADCDTIDACDILLFLRHTDQYPYQNIWLEIAIDSTLTDTIEFYLANQRGQWLGSKNSRLYEMPVIYKNNYHFLRNDSCLLQIRHLMREPVLKGVSSVGVTIQKAQQ